MAQPSWGGFSTVTRAAPEVQKISEISESAAKEQLGEKHLQSYMCPPHKPTVPHQGDIRARPFWGIGDVAPLRTYRWTVRLTLIFPGISGSGVSK